MAICLILHLNSFRNDSDFFRIMPEGWFASGSMPAIKLGGGPNFEGYALEMKCSYSMVVSGRLTSKKSSGGEDIRNYLRKMAEDIGIVRGSCEKV